MIECPICHKEIEKKSVLFSVTHNYMNWEYAGLFGGKPETGTSLVDSELTGLYQCLSCGAEIHLFANGGNKDDLIITGHKYDANPI